MNPLVVIPTFISGRRRKTDGSPITTYDHPTPLADPGDLSRCLESLTRVKGFDQVPIAILISSEPAVAVQAEEKIRAVVAEYPLLTVMVIGTNEMSLIRQRFEQLKLGTCAKEIGLQGYSAVRNLGLIIANVLGFDATIFLDDDEVIEDPEFLSEAVYGLGKLTRKGIPILVKTGYYLNAEGSYHSSSQNRWYNHWWQQGKAFNQWIDSAMRGPRLSRSNHVCGGCLALHREAFRRLAFDPWIPRGEDLDYLLNLRMYGSDIWFDNKWSLRHLPPENRNEGKRFRQDIFRWLYEYRKVEFSRTQIDLQQIKPASLEPYPGPFLEPGIHKRIKRTALLRSLARPDKMGYRAAAKAATNEAAEYAEKNCDKYFTFQSVWPEIMARTANDRILYEALLQSAVVPSPDIEPQPARGFDPGVTSEIRLNLAD